MTSLEGTPAAAWRIRGRTLDLGPRPLVMGILNVTPDSFSDGGAYATLATARARIETMVAEGVDIIDIGGESTRPGAQPVPLDEELRRVLPVIEAAREVCDLPLSVDTTKGEVARAALAAGAHIVNNVGALRLDPSVAEAAAEHGAGLVLMHMQGEPRTMQAEPRYTDLLGEIRGELEAAMERAAVHGVPLGTVAVDPGIGFGKTAAHNWRILQGLGAFVSLGVPLLVGTSRKRFLRECVGEDPADLAAATVASCVAACLAGARVIRVHDVRAHRAAMEATGRLLAGRG